MSEEIKLQAALQSHDCRAKMRRHALASRNPSITPYWRKSALKLAIAWRETGKSWDAVIHHIDHKGGAK